MNKSEVEAKLAELKNKLTKIPGQMRAYMSSIGHQQGVENASAAREEEKGIRKEIKRLERFLRST